MQNNRDSSIFRSLAVAVGSGLALGVGMTLTQRSGRTGEAPLPRVAPEDEIASLLKRLDQIEERIVKVECAPPAAAPAPAPFDRKVLAAIVGAVDVRLLGHSGQVEKRLAEMEARLTMELKALPPPERLEAIEERVGQMERAHGSAAPAAPFDRKVLAAIVNALDGRLRDQAGQVERQLEELEAKLSGEMKALQQQQDRAVSHGVQSHIEELNGQFNDQLAAIRRRSEEERAAMQREISSLLREFAVETAHAVDARVADLRAEIQSRDSQIAELRSRLEAGDESLRNVVVAIAQACQIAVARPAVKSKAESECTPLPSETPLPSFAQTRPAARVMPLPLVSSLALVSAAGVAMMHYL